MPFRACGLRSWSLVPQGPPKSELPHLLKIPCWTSHFDIDESPGTMYLCTKHHNTCSLLQTRSCLCPPKKPYLATPPPQPASSCAAIPNTTEATHKHAHTCVLPFGNGASFAFHIFCSNRFATTHRLRHDGSRKSPEYGHHTAR